MRIAILWQQEQSGGVDAHLWSLLKNWPDLSDSFIIFYNKGNNGYLRLKKEFDSLPNVKLISYQSYSYQPLSSQINNKVLSFLVKSIAYIFLPFSVRMMTNKIGKLLVNYGNFDAIIANNGGYPAAWDCISAIYAAEKILIPKRIMLVHHEATKRKKLRYARFEKRVDNKIQKSLTDLITVSFATRQSIIDNRLFNPMLLPIQVIHNGIDEEYAKHNTNDIKLRKTFSLSDKSLIGMIGRIEKYKGHEDLIIACSMLPAKYLKKIKIIFIGNGEIKEINRLKKLANSNGLLSYIVFTGYLPGSSFNIIKQLDLLLSMTQDFEGFGLTIAEAMIVKTSVIATDVGAVSEFFNNSVGDLVPSKSPQIVAEKIIQYLDNPNSFLEKKENAEKIIKNQFNAKLMSENFRKILHKSSNQSLI